MKTIPPAAAVVTSPATVQPWRKMAALPELTIDDALVRFLDAQRSRLAPRTFRRYEEICDLLRHCLNGYGHTGLSGLELKRWERAYEAGDEEAFCHLMGPEHLVDNLGEFLGYFMIRKVAAGQEVLRAAGTVTKSLARWLTSRDGSMTRRWRSPSTEGATRPETFPRLKSSPVCCTS